MAEPLFLEDTADISAAIADSVGLPFATDAEFAVATAAATQLGLGALSDGFIVEGTATALAKIATWNADMSEKDTRRATVLFRNVLGMMLDGSYLQANNEQQTPCDDQDEATVLEFMRRAGQVSLVTEATSTESVVPRMKAATRPERANG